MVQSGAFFVAGQSLTPDGGIYRFEFAEQGRVFQADFTPLPRCNYLAFSPNRKFLYATCVVGDSGGVAAFRVNDDLSLTELNRCSAEGTSTCHLTTDRNGAFLFCANYSSGSFTEFELASDGSIARRTRVISHQGHGPDPERQEGPHVHQTMLTPDGKFLSVVDLGIDKVMLYPLHDQLGVMVDSATVCRVEPAGEGPRHLVFNAVGDTAYLLNELGNSVSRLAYADGVFTFQKSWTTLPAQYAGFSKAAAIRMSYDGRFVLASNRGCDTIAVFRVLPDGDLERSDIVFAWGESPRDFDFIGNGCQIAVTNENNDNMTICAFDPVTGAVSSDEQYFELPHPLCVLRV